MEANVPFDFILKIPLSCLNVQKPTTMCLRLVVYIDGQEQDVNFAITR